jgi:hypothetical protein
MTSTIISCCGTEQWISADMMTGYGEVTKAYFAMASHTSLTATLEVNVFP